MVVHFGDASLDGYRRQLYLGDAPLHVSPKAFQLLAILIEERPRALSKAELQERLWPETFVTEGNLASLIAELRSALGDDARSPKYIRTLHGFGYAFEAPVVDDGASQAREAEPETAAPAIERAVARTAPAGWSAAALVAIVILVAAASVWITKRDVAESAVGAPAPIRSLAILPFDASGAGDASSHLGLGLSDLVITRLSNVRELTVRPTSAVRGFAGREIDSAQAGRELRVDGVLEGSVRMDGERVRVTVQLIDVRQRKPVWAGRFDEMRTEMFGIEDRISDRVADAVLVRLTPDEKTRLAKRHTASPEAYDLYMQGRYHLANSNAGGPVSASRNALDLFGKAVEADPQYALAWAALAETHAITAGGGRGDPAVHWPKAEAAALRALAIDPGASAAFTSLAAVKMYWHIDYAGAEREFQKALERNPHDTRALGVYGYLLQCLGRFDEALETRKRALEIDPLDPTWHWATANVYLTAKRYDIARSKIEDVLAVRPDHYEANIGLIRLELAEGDYEEAVRLGRALVARDPRPRGRGFLGYALARSGREEEARAILRDLDAMSQTEFVSSFNLMTVLMGLGEYDAVFPLLERAVIERDYILRLKTEPVFDPLRSDPRFQTILRRAGFTS